MATASDVIARVRDLIQDVEADRYTDTELCRWINDAQLEAVRIAPQANADFIDMPVVAGSIQKIPVGALKLVRVFCNGSLANQGKSPTETTMDTLNRADPSWRNSTPALTFDHYVVEKNRERFHVYPPSSGGNCVVEVGARPGTVNDIFDSLDLDDRYVPMITNYVAARALSKDAEHVTERTLAQDYMKQFTEGLLATVQTA